MIRSRGPWRPDEPVADQQDDEPDPEEIDGFQILERIGRGGFGTVYKAFDPRLQTYRAIKVPRFKPGLLAEERTRLVDLFLNEAQSLARLKHRHIVPIYHCGRFADDRCYLVLEWIDGMDLAQQMAQGRPSVEESVEIVASIAEALVVLHKNRVVHRDLKPANILLDGEGIAYLSDFGLALTPQGFLRWGHRAGTPVYSSPEQARGGGDRVHGSSDVFSLGVVFYELLTGQRPFEGRTPDELFQCIAEVEPRPLRELDPSIPRGLQSLCRQALAKLALDRISAYDLAEELRGYQNATRRESVVPVSVANNTRPPAASPRVFLSYRRADTQAFARLLCERLRGRFGEDAVFFDVTTIGPGDEFRRRIGQSLAQCDVVLAVIGSGWFGTDEQGRRRLDDPEDYVRLEIEIALARRDVRVIPILYGTTPLPVKAELPTSLAPLVDREARRLDPGVAFDLQVEGLIRDLQRLVASRAELPPSPWPLESPRAATTTAGETAPLRPIARRGLRSFEAEDKEFFLQLLPGQPDQDGIPPGVRFWLTRLTETDPDRTFPVGLITGPSGCGKSSLVKAGILPRLPDYVVPVRIEATPNDTERDLVDAIRRKVPTLPRNVDLTAALQAVIAGDVLPRNRKLLLVLDQFEQWLLAHPEPAESELLRCASALRRPAAAGRGDGPRRLYHGRHAVPQCVESHMSAGHQLGCCRPVFPEPRPPSAQATRASLRGPSFRRPAVKPERSRLPGPGQPAIGPGRSCSLRALGAAQ